MHSRVPSDAGSIARLACTRLAEQARSAIASLTVPGVDGKARASDQPDVAPAKGARTPAQALLWGLRRKRDEAQLTQVIAEVARADSRFASAFVELLLEVAANGPHGVNVRRLTDKGIPVNIGCRAEQHLRDTGDSSLGRVDLRFDGGDDFTLFVENKLYAGYGDDQVNRYLAALDRLPEERRSGLIAVTRNVPTYGEPRLEESQRWLGSVRWAHLRDGLRTLPIADPELCQQWQLFIDVLDQQGDLGMTSAQPDLIRAWALYRQGRDHLVDLLDQIQQPACAVVEAEVVKRYGKKAKGQPLVSQYARGKKQQVVQRDQVSVYLGFRIPANVKDSAVLIQFNGYFGVPHFTIEARPWNAEWLLDRDDRPFVAAARMLESKGFQSNGRRWAKIHDPSEYIDASDVPARLMELVSEAIPSLVQSGILDHEVEATLRRDRGGPPRERNASGGRTRS